MKKNQNQVAEWRKKSKESLITERKELQAELIKTRVSLSLQKEKNSSLVKKLRRSIARIETIIREGHSHA